MPIERFGWVHPLSSFTPASFIEDQVLFPKMLSGLLRLLERDGFDRIADAVGVDADVD
jgi:dihydroorotate dehydrogenase